MIACPTPDKRVFHDEATAAERADVIRASGGDDLEPYPCPCERWHLRNAARAASSVAFHAKRNRRTAKLLARRAAERKALGFDLDDMADEIMEAMGLGKESGA